MARPPELKVGQTVMVEGRVYDLVYDGEGGATLEPAVTGSATDSIKSTGGSRATPEEVEAFVGDISTDEEWFTPPRVVHADVQREDGSYWASVREIAGAITQAGTLDDLVMMLTDVISLQLEDNEARRRNQEDPTAEHVQDAWEDKWLARVLTLELEIERSHRSDHADSISEPRKHSRQSHRGDRAAKWNRPEHPGPQS